MLLPVAMLASLLIISVATAFLIAFLVLGVDLIGGVGGEMSEKFFESDHSKGFPAISTHCGSKDKGRCVQLTATSDCVEIPIKFLPEFIERLQTTYDYSLEIKKDKKTPLQEVLIELMNRIKYLPEGYDFMPLYNKIENLKL